MNNQNFTFLLIDSSESRYAQIKQLLKEGLSDSFQLEWVSNVTDAYLASKKQNYDAYLFHSQVGNVQDWCLEVNPKPVILITDQSSIGIQSLSKGVSDYWLEDHLNPILMEHSLRLSLDHYQTKINFRNAQLEELKNEFQILKIVLREKVIALEEMENIFNQLVENTNSVFWIQCVKDHKFVYISPAYAKIWGELSEEHYDNLFIHLASIHYQDRDRVLSDWETLKQGKETEIEYRILDNKGYVHWIHTRSCPITDEQGKVIRVVGISDDITDRKKTEIELEKMRKLYETLAETVPVGIYQNDAQGDCIYINQKTSDMLDISVSECLGNGWINRLHPDDALGGRDELPERL